jgi:alkanesulfonate monooxygenase SsuD/methylene tetrahydromethanopterin reductase-like flavin-dependent oxidoreductase (luciferase family)
MSEKTYRERVGIAFFPRSSDAAVDLCVRAERAQVDNAWMVMPATALDTLTVLAAAAVKTERIVLGTSIVPAFTRHPLAFVTQALALEGLAPGRFDLGIGSAHARTMVDVYHVDFELPLRRRHTGADRGAARPSFSSRGPTGRRRYELELSHRLYAASRHAGAASRGRQRRPGAPAADGPRPGAGERQPG